MPLSDLRRISYSPFPVELNLIPVTQFLLRGSLSTTDGIDSRSGVGVHAVGPVAFVRKEFVVRGLRLADFEAAH